MNFEKNDAQFWSVYFWIDRKFYRIWALGTFWWTLHTINWKKRLRYSVVAINETFIKKSLGHQMRRNMGIMVNDNFYFETKQEKIQMKKIFFVFFVIVILMISFLVYDSKLRQLDLKNHKTISLMNQILEFRWVWLYIQSSISSFQQENDWKWTSCWNNSRFNVISIRGHA